MIALAPATGRGLWKATTDWNDPRDAWGPGSDVLCLAARGDQVVIGHRTKGLVRWLNPADGAKQDETAVPEPRAVTLDAASNVLAISGTSIVKLSRTDKNLKTLVAGLLAPARLTVDPASGDIFVAERAESHQIKRFSAEGKPPPRPGGQLEVLPAA